MMIETYRQWNDIDIYFPEYNCTVKHIEYSQFKKGQVKCPYEPRVYNIGYFGEGPYKAGSPGNMTKEYDTWHSMMSRCYDTKLHIKYSVYKDCSVCDEWLNFQEYGKWFSKNYYEIPGEKMCLDKDILIKGNKIYSPNTCVFVPEKINILFTKHDTKRGNYPIGVIWHERDKMFEARCNIQEDGVIKRKYLGRFNNAEEAFSIYKRVKEQHIKDIADLYKESIPEALYKALYEYEVEWTD